MTTIEDVLAQIRDVSENSKEIGDRFERLMLAFFKTERSYQKQFEQVWMWNDWPGNQNKPDTGIDLVAKNVDDDGFTAIQCKNYSPTTSLTKEDIDSFFTASGKEEFTRRIIACTTNLWSKHAEDALHGQTKPVQRIGVEHLSNSTIDWSQWDINSIDALTVNPRKRPRVHQNEAIANVLEGLQHGDRGKLIMACGTGKTYTGQIVAEQQVGPGGTVLVLMPSISLLSQTLKEWTADASIPIDVYAICSDAKAGKKRDIEDISPYDLILPATTDPDLLIAQHKRASSPDAMSVFFSTYQSLPVISAAQTAGIPEFDLIICDEAHRTTGVTLHGEDDSHFTKVHDDVNIKAKKRLYMTATPRVFSDAAKGKARSADAWVASMDDQKTFGQEFHRLGFHEAVERDLLTDYKVLVLAVDEQAVSAAFQQQLSDDDHELKLDDATRIVGCVNALAKRDLNGETFDSEDPPMQRALAFSNTIAQSKKFKALFGEIATQYEVYAKSDTPFHAEVDHVDGKFNSMQREELLSWLKGDPGDNSCHVLSNARCLTEGVDVPALDAIMFLEPRNSMVDVIQAVGRVMRKSEGKKFGYVVIPIGIPADENPERALNDNKRFKAVWQVLNALRSHDERMNAVINKLDLNDAPPDMIEVIPVGIDMGEDDSDPDNATGDQAEKPKQLELNFPFEEIRDGIYAKLVLKVGTRHYWEDWATDVAEISSKHETRIKALINDPTLGLGKEFDHFVEGLHTIINDSITRDDAIGMLSQHLITKPIFDTLFDEYDFSTSNPVSKAMQAMIDRLDEHSLDKETESLEGFYDSVRLRVEGIDNAAGKQRIITELYEGFFSKAFPKAAESLGIVYTPIELVDFVLHAADHALRKHFNGTRMSDEGVNILDPFCGTGTFLVRLLQSGIIKPEDLARKYAKELHSNELLLLAYYIAAINIESTYHDVNSSNESDVGYEPFNGVVLTDTFQLGETGEGTGTFDVFPVNNERATTQKGLGIRVIVGNPPYSIGQTSENDNNQNLTYPRLNDAIRRHYAAPSAQSIGKKSNYDAYIKAIRWATDRVLSSEHGGVIGFVVNGGFLASNALDGFRNSLSSEFHHIYCYNLRGNQRTAGEQSRMEGGKVFGAGSRATIAIIILVKEQDQVPDRGAEIHYRDIGDYLSREEKLEIVASAATTDALDQVDWTPITPNRQGDWINQRSEVFQSLQPLTAQDDDPTGIRGLLAFSSYGAVTARDAWVYNSSKSKVEISTKKMVQFFNDQLDWFHRTGKSAGSQAKAADVRKVVVKDPGRFSWNLRDYARIARNERLDELQDLEVVEASYRPFFKQHLNSAPSMSHSLNSAPIAFPSDGKPNIAICASAPGAAGAFAAIMVDAMPDLTVMGAGNPTYMWPRHVYDERDESEDTLFSGADASDIQHNVTDDSLRTYQADFGADVTKDSIFYYVYGIFNSSDYRTAFAADLSKQTPRVPQVKSEQDFWEFSQAGRDLADLHVNYEAVEPWQDLEISYKEGFDPNSPDDFRVQKMRYAKSGKETDLTTLIYNSNITISGIPESAHEYRVGSRSAIGWIIDRYQIRTHNDSGIVNDPNDWADEHDDPTYIFDLLRRIVTVSMKTNEIVAGLPKLDFTE